MARSERCVMEGRLKVDGKWLSGYFSLQSKHLVLEPDTWSSNPYLTSA